MLGTFIVKTIYELEHKNSLIFVFMILLVIYLFSFNIMTYLILINISIWGNMRLCIVFILRFANHILWKILTIGLLITLFAQPYRTFGLSWVFVVLIVIKILQIPLFKIMLGNELRSKADVWKMKLCKTSQKAE